MNGRSRTGPSARERIGSAAAVAVVTAGLGWLLAGALTYTGYHDRVEPRLASFDVLPPPPPPPPDPPPPRHAAARARQAAAPAARRAVPTPVVAPPPVVLLPVPPVVATAPVAGIGAGISAGAADSGSGTGAGGAGDGRGGGGDGDGGTDIRLIRDKRKDDLPPAARHLDGVRTVGMRWVVGVDGRVHDCRVTRSSGDADLDMQTCALLSDQLRYAPARDAAGRRIPVVVDDAEQRWEVSHDGGAGRNRDGDGDGPRS